MGNEGKKKQSKLLGVPDIFNPIEPTFKQELEFELSELEKDYAIMIKLQVFIPEEINDLYKLIQKQRRILETLKD